MQTGPSWDLEDEGYDKPYNRKGKELMTGIVTGGEYRQGKVAVRVLQSTYVHRGARTEEQWRCRGGIWMVMPESPSASRGSGSGYPMPGFRR